jgi:hypothetical protein
MAVNILYTKRQNGRLAEWHTGLPVWNVRFLCRVWSSRLRHSVLLYTVYDVSEEHLPFTFRIKDKSLKMEASCSSETLVSTYKSTRHFYPEYRICGWVVNTPASYLGGPGFRSRPGDRLSWLRFYWFSSAPAANAGIVPYIRPRPLPSISFPTHHSPVTLSFDSIKSKLLKTRR